MALIRLSCVVLATIAVLPLTLTGCQSVDAVLKSAPKPTARVTGTHVQGLTLEKVDLLFDVEVRNPYAIALPLVDVSYALEAGGQRLVRGSVTPPGSIPASGSKTVQVPAAVEFRSLLAALQDVRPGSVVPYTADVTLGVDAPVIGRLNLPVSHRGELPVPAVPEASLVGFEISTLTLDKVSATARLRLKNTNAFDLDLSKLALNLALGGKDVAHTAMVSGARLAPGQSATLDAPISFSPRAFGIGVFNLLRGSESAYAISGSVEGGTRFGPLALPFKASGNTPISR